MNFKNQSNFETPFQIHRENGHIMLLVSLYRISAAKFKKKIVFFFFSINKPPAIPRTRFGKQIENRYYYFFFVFYKTPFRQLRFIAYRYTEQT